MRFTLTAIADVILTRPEVFGDEADFLYKCTELYSPENARCIRWDAPDLAIDGPLLDGKSPLVSATDATTPSFNSGETYP